MHAYIFILFIIVHDRNAIIYLSCYGKRSSYERKNKGAISFFGNFKQFYLKSTLLRICQWTKHITQEKVYYI